MAGYLLGRFHKPLAMLGYNILHGLKQALEGMYIPYFLK